MKKLTTEQFIEKAVKIHFEKFDYSLVEYKGTLDPVKIICRKCGKTFSQRPNDHLSGHGCSFCGGTKSNRENFISKVSKMFQDYDYSLVDYKNNKEKVKIICKVHGEFSRTPQELLTGIGCPICRKIENLEKRKNHFIEKAKKVHNNLYDYSLVNYVNDNTKVKIICRKCGKTFIQKPNDHLNGHGCGCDKKTRNLTTEQFIEKAVKIHFEKFDYSLVNYKSNKEKVKIICRKCGKTFSQIPSVHLSGNGCSFCANRNKTIDDFYKKAKTDLFEYDLNNFKNFSSIIDITCKRCKNRFSKTISAHLSCPSCPNCGKTVKLTTEQFIEKSKKIHNDFYDYSETVYTNNKTKVKIICPKHGIFEQVPKDHLKGIGCPICKSSKGEKAIIEILQENNIEFVSQKKFPDCKYKKLLPFDFYIPSKNLLIEFDGKQHYEPNDFFGGKSEFELTRKRDEIKTQFALTRGFKFVRIKYDENIREKLEVILNGEKN